MLTKKFTALAALYAANVLDGGRTIDEVPAVIRPQVQEILDDSKKEDATPQS